MSGDDWWNKAKSNVINSHIKNGDGEVEPVNKTLVKLIFCPINWGRGTVQCRYKSLG